MVGNSVNLVTESVQNVTQIAPKVTELVPEASQTSRSKKKDPNPQEDNWLKEINAAMKVVFSAYKFTPSPKQEGEYGQAVMKVLNIFPVHQASFAKEHAKKWMAALCSHRNYVQVSSKFTFFLLATKCHCISCVTHCSSGIVLGAN